MYVTLEKTNGRYSAHKISSEKPDEQLLNNKELLTKDFENIDKIDNDDESSTVNQPSNLSKFNDIIESFNSIIETYRTMIMSTIGISPIISSSLANRSFGEFVADHCTRIDTLDTDDICVFEVSKTLIPTVIKRNDMLISALNGSKHLPELAIIGLISVYDAYLGNIIRHVLTTYDKFTFSSEKQIKFSDLIKYNSIDDAKAAIIENEVDTALRGSHKDQIIWINNKFGANISFDTDIWPLFIEVCEHRNLLTHTGGRVSKQYINVCKQEGFKTQKQVGETLTTDMKYLENSINIIHEFGLKIGYYLWRKLTPMEAEAADEHLNHTAVNLTNQEEYLIAENLLTTALQFKGKRSELLRRMMIINLANTMRLQNKQPEAIKLIDKEDWSAASSDLQICMYSVIGDIDKVCEIMPKIDTKQISETEYQDWPVFIKTREDHRFKKTYTSLFAKELFILPTNKGRSERGTRIARVKRPIPDHKEH